MKVMMGYTNLWILHILTLIAVPAVAQFDFNPYELFGCFDKKSNDFPAITPGTFSGSLTLKKCRDSCEQKSSTYFAVSNGDTCGCFQTALLTKVDDNPMFTLSCYNEKAKRCEGNHTEYCGADDAYLIYSVCPPGSSGENCDQVCSCDHSENLCRFGASCETRLCYPGYEHVTGQGCKVCGTDKYGFKCSQQCLNCTGSCDSKTGACVKCGPGKGPYCLGTCPTGKWGSNCEETCTERCLDGKCNHDNGHCTACEESSGWGDTCQHTCHIKCEPQECDLKTGVCKNGCNDGSYGEYCNITCPPNCSVKCDKPSGDCTNGCDTSTWGVRCDSKCPENCAGGCNETDGACVDACKCGSYGDFCNISCPANCLDSTCDKDSGVCNKGCSEGWKGAICNETCPIDNCLKCEQYGEVCNKCETGHCGENCETLLCPTTTEPPATTTGGDVDVDGDFSITTVAGACAGGAVFIIIIVIIIIYCCIRRGMCKKTPPEEKPIVMTTPVAVPTTSDHGMDEYEQVDVQASAAVSGVDNPIYHRDPDRTFPESAYEVGINKIKEKATSPQAEEAIKKEYGTLPKGKKRPWDKAQGITSKNRYKQLYAYDHSRVVMEENPNDPNSDYINANYLPNFNRSKAFIACQGPHNDETVADFIRMLWECKVSTVVATAKLEEMGKNGKPSMKFKAYWPDSVGQDKRYGAITVKLSSQQELTDFTIRKLCLKKQGQEHKVTQFHYTAWPEQNVPQVAAPLLNFHARVKRHLQLLHIGRNTPPVVVHCSAGIGRTGVYIALDALLQQMNTEGVVDVQGCVKRLREDRVDMVQSNDQYTFLYDALCEALDLGNTTIECGLLTHTLQKWRNQSPSPIEKQFSLLEKMKPEINHKLQEYALSDTNNHKNRFRNIVAATEARVRLKGDAHEDYINAVAVDGYKRPGAFHVTQMPLEHTIQDFWRMVWENKYPVMVALLKQDEAGEGWCPHKEYPLELNDLGLEVVLHSEHAQHRHIMAMDISLCQTGERDSTYQNVDQPNGTTDGNHRWSIYANEDALMQAHKLTMYWVHQINARSLRQAFKLVKGKLSTADRVCVMCLDGCENCGAYVTSYNLLDMAQTEREIDVFETVRQVRVTRPQFIKDLEQYKFLYTVVEEYQKES